MTRAVVLGVTLSLLPAQCAKLLARADTPPAADSSPPAPPPVPIPSATTPPVWTPPEPAPAPAPTPSASPELVKARAAADAKDWKKVRSLLEKRVRTVKASADEARLLGDACAALKDRTCLDVIHAGYPEVSTSQ